MLGTPPNSIVVRALGEGASGTVTLQGLGGSPGSTLRGRLRELAVAGVIDGNRGNGSRGPARYELTEAGRELLSVTEILGRWLLASPNGALPLGGEGAKAAVKALGEGWSATLVRALAAGPLSVTELDALIDGFGYPCIERRMSAMRLVGQVEARPARGRETPYAVTDWLRRAAAPLLAAIRWEQRHGGGKAAPVAAIDFEALMLLAVPLLVPEAGLNGSCRLAVELPGGSRRCLAGVHLKLRDGLPAACSTRLDGEHADAWAIGSLAAWLGALVDGDTAALELGGDAGLACALTEGLHRALLGAPARARVETLPLGDARSVAA